jgi:hypothetical protein
MGALVGGIYATGQIGIFEEWISSCDVKEGEEAAQNAVNGFGK